MNQEISLNYTRNIKPASLTVTKQKNNEIKVDNDLYTPGGAKTEESNNINPQVLLQKNRLAELGILFKDPSNLLLESEQIQLMKNLEDVVSKLPKEKRPVNLPIIIEAKDAKGTAAGRYSPVLKDIVIYRNGKNEKPFTMERLFLTSVHEYGHAVSDAIKPDKEGENPYEPMTDKKGQTITERAVKLEEEAKKDGHTPDDIADDATVTIWDRLDPYVESHTWAKDGVKQEKYTRKNFKEHYAETFREYISYPERFKDKIGNMEKELTSLTNGTPEYNYLTESIDIMKESYNYFKDKVFDGHEFKTEKTNVLFNKLMPILIEEEEYYEE